MQFHPEHHSVPSEPLQTEQNNRGQKKRALIGILLAFVLPYLCLLPYARMFGFKIEDPLTAITVALIVSRALLWTALIGMFVYSRRIERAPLVAWDEKPYNAGMYVAFLIGTFGVILVLVVILGLVLRLTGLHEESSRLQSTVDLLTKQPWLALLTCITAAVVEELFFRGYMQPRIEYLLKSRVAAIVITSAAFGLIHFGFGTVVNTVGPLLIGAVFATHYSLFRNLKVLIVIHFLWDVLALYIAHVRAELAQ